MNQLAIGVIITECFVCTISMQATKNPTDVFSCKKCGNCCQQYWDIILTREDVLKWIRHSKNEFLKHIQINPLSISPAGLSDYTYGESVIEIPGLVERREENKEFNKVEFEKRLEIMRNFVLDNHDYNGESEASLPVYSYFSFFFPVETYFGGIGPFPIFRPRSFTVMLKGLNLEVKYVLSFDSHGHCIFLNENLCSIHEIKPVACQKFPFNQDGSLRVDERVLDICQGITNSI